MMVQASIMVWISVGRWMRAFDCKPAGRFIQISRFLGAD